MKICVVQPDLSRIGGSISTIMSFADCFKQLGHEVNVKSSFGGRFPKNLIPKKEEVINYHGLQYLSNDDITWDYKMGTRVDTDADICFTRGFEYKTVHKYPSIIWCIIKQELYHSRDVIEFWTNSHTTKSTFGKLKNKTQVLIPPHDYSLFRKYSGQEKEYDIVSILRGNDFKLKGLSTYANTVKELGLKSMLITTATDDKVLQKIKDLNIPFVINQTKEQVAEILGKSKIFFFPSYYESCPLVIYEALNAGNTIVSRNIGAVNEQIGNTGYLFNQDKDILKTIKQALNNPVDYRKCIERGELFDRENQIINIDNQLKQVERRIYQWEQEK